MAAEPTGVSKRVSKTAIEAEIMKFSARQDDGGHEYVRERRLRLDQKPLLDDLFSQKDGGQAFCPSMPRATAQEKYKTTYRRQRWKAPEELNVCRYPTRR
jgi:hypothetical protein